MEISLLPWAWAPISIAVITLLSIVFAAGRWVGRFGQKVDGVGEKVDQKIDVIRQKVDSVDENLKSTNLTLSTFMTEIREDIKRIFGRLPPTSLEHNSPMRLSKMGADISMTLGATTWAKRTAASERMQMAGKPEYDVQEFCFDYVRRFKPDPELDALIKACAYQHGIDRDAVLAVLAIELRDVLLDQTDRVRE